jgi:hypothetical protein
MDRNPTKKKSKHGLTRGADGLDLAKLELSITKKSGVGSATKPPYNATLTA